MAKPGLYETRTLTALTSTEAGCVLANVQALARPGWLCVIAGNRIHLVPEGAVDATASLITLEFDSKVDAVGWTDDFSLVVVGDRNGVLHFVSPTTEQILFSQVLPLAHVQSGNADTPVVMGIEFTKPCSNGLLDLLVLGSNNILFIFQDIHLARFGNVLLQGDVDAVKQIQEGIKLSQLELSRSHDDHTTFFLGLDTCSIITTGYGNSPVSFWQRSAEKSYTMVDSISYILQGIGITRGEVTSDGRFFVAHTDTQTVAVWLLSSLVIVSIWTGEPVKDLALCQSTSSHHPNGRQCTDRLCLIIEGRDQTMLTIVSVPGLHTLTTIAVRSTTILCHGYITEESLYFLDVEDGVPEKPCVHIKQLIQALPEDRLATLLAQQKFEEAEEFAKKFSLDPELVYRRKAQVLNDLLCREPVGDPESTRGSLSQCLDHIKDVQFVVDMAMLSSYPTLETTLWMLKRAKEKLPSTAPQNYDTRDAKLKVLSALNRLVTFQMVYGENGYSPQLWRSFLEKSLLEELTLQLQIGNLQYATWIWGRHQPALLTELDVSSLFTLFQAVPESVPSSQLTAWLTDNMLPFVLQHMPEFMADLLSWVEQRTRQLELTEKELWPSNGLDMINSVMEAVQSFRNSAARMSIHVQTAATMEFSLDPHSPLAALTSLKKKLGDLQYLYTSLKCTVCLSDYEKEPHEAVVFRLLDKVIAVELVASTIQSSVLPYVERHGLDLDKTLLQYIELFLGQAPRYSTSLSDNPWEAKAIAIIQTITNRELYVTGCVELLKHVHTPWSETVEDLVQDCLKVDHPSVAVLQKQYSLLQLKKMLHSYGVRDFNFSNSSKGMLYIRRILALGGARALDDALQVAEMYQLSTTHVYIYHIMHLGLQDKLVTVLEVLRSLPTREEQIVAAEGAFSSSYTRLQLPFSTELDDPCDYSSAAKVALVCLKFLKNCVKEGDSCVVYEDGIDDRIGILKRILSLQLEYSIYITPQELSDPAKCKELFKSKVQECQNELLSTAAKENSSESAGHGRGGWLVSEHYHDVVRFCELLGCSEDHLYADLVSACARNNQMTRAREICWSLVRHAPSPSTAPVLFSLVQCVWQSIGNSLGVSSSITQEDLQAAEELSAMATALCSPDHLLDCVELYRLSALLCSLYSQCEGSTGGEEEEEERVDKDTSFTDWGWSPRFREDGLVLEQSAVLPLAVQYALARLPGDWLHSQGEWQSRRRKPFEPWMVALNQGAGDIQDMLMVASRLNRLLQDNGHSLLTLRCTAETIGVCSLFSSHGDASSFADVLQIGKATVCEVMNNLIKKVLSSRRIDHVYALALLLTLPPERTMEKLQGIRSKSVSSYSKVIALCTLAMDYGSLTGQTSVVEQAAVVLSSAEWGKRLSKYKISFTEAFRGGNPEKAKVVSTLLRSSEVELELIFQYCNDFGLDVQSTLISYLRILLTEWGIGYQDRAALVLHHIQNKSICHNILASLLTRMITPYDYERIVFVLQNLVGVEQAAKLSTEQGLLLMDCLRRYPRTAVPSQYERQWYIKHYTSTDSQGKEELQSLTEVVLPEPSESKLPFHPILYGSPMEIIKPELSKNTVGKLEPVARILRLSMDKFFAAAIENVVKSLDASKQDRSSSDPVAFGDVAPLLARINDANLALAIAKWLTRELHNESSRTEALKAALVISKEWKDQAQTEDQRRAASEKVEIFQQLLRITETERLLQQHDLGWPELMELSNQGATLIMRLYTDVPTSTTPGKVPPVHLVAAKLAAQYNLNLDKIKRRLVEQWLPSTCSSSQEMDVTQMSMLEDPTELDEGEEETEDQLTMRRLVYLLSAPENLEAHALLLLNWAKRTSSTSSNLSRVRALQILFAIAPPELIETFSNAPISEIRDYMQRVMFATELEALHMSTSVSAFQGCSKEGLVKGLWRNHSNEPRALRLMCELCLYYQIFDTSLWNKILEQLLSMHLVPYLRHVLKTLASRPGCGNISSLPTIWQRMLLAPFQEAAVPLSARQKQECVETLKMLYGCPFPLELDVNAVIGAFCSVAMRSHALAAVLIIPTQADRSEATQRILHGLRPEQVVVLLDEVTAEHHAYFTRVPELVYLHLNSLEQHTALLGSPHFPSYVHFLVSRRLLDSLLTKTIQANRLNEAIRLVEMYNSHHRISSSLRGMQALEEYITTYELKVTLCGVAGSDC